MSLPANTFWQVQTTGSDTNGGGFVLGSTGTDWSQQASPQYSVTDGVTNGTTTITSATASFGTDVVGNIIYVSGGTGSVTAARYQIVSRTNSTTIVVDRSTGLSAGTGVTLNIGGALATPQAAPLTTDFAMYILAGTYTGSTWSIHVSGRVYGRGSSRSDLSSKPTLSFAVSYGYDGTEGNPVAIFSRLSVTGSVTFGERSIVEYVDVTSTMFFGHQPARAFACSAACFVSGSGNYVFLSHCVAYGGGGGFGRGFDLQTNVVVILESCYAIGCTGNGFNLYNSESNGCYNCVAYGCGASGFRFEGASSNENIHGCLSVNSTGYGFELATAGTRVRLSSCRGYGNSSGTYNSNWYADSIEDVSTLSANPFTAAGSYDFSLTSASGLRAAAPPSSFPRLSTSNYRDFGPAQHQDSGGGGGGSTFMGRGVLSGGRL